MRRCTDVVELLLWTALFPGHSASRFSRTPRAAAPSLHAGHAPGRGGDNFVLPPHARDLAGGTGCKAGQVRVPGHLPRLPRPVSPRARACCAFPSTSLHCPPSPSSAEPPPQPPPTGSSTSYPLPRAASCPPLSGQAIADCQVASSSSLHRFAAGSHRALTADVRRGHPKPGQHLKSSAGGT
jgi:hypothetical protein